MRKPCEPVPCPSFETVTFTDVRPIGWYGVNYPLLEPAPEFLAKSRHEQVETLAWMVATDVAIVREKHGYSDDTIVQVHLPSTSALSHLFPEVMEIVGDGVEFR